MFLTFAKTKLGKVETFKLKSEEKEEIQFCSYIYQSTYHTHNQIFTKYSWKYIKCLGLRNYITFLRFRKCKVGSE